MGLYSIFSAGERTGEHATVLAACPPADYDYDEALFSRFLSTAPAARRPTGRIHPGRSKRLVPMRSTMSTAISKRARTPENPMQFPSLEVLGHSLSRVAGGIAYARVAFC